MHIIAFFTVRLSSQVRLATCGLFLGGEKELWIRFNLPCDGDTQRILHKVFRKEIKKWEKGNLVTGVVLTYHFNNPPDPDVLYLCLDMPTVKTPLDRSLYLSEETVRQIPSEIMEKITHICNKNHVKLGNIIDYEFDVASAREDSRKAGKSYYRNASTEEVLRFASTGTKIALNLLDGIENRKITFLNNMELADIILSRLKEELGEKYSWLREAFHFVCNPMLISPANDAYLWTLAIS